MKNLTKLVTSKRAIITTLMIVCWIVFGIMAIKNGSNLKDLATYFASLSPFVIGYIYGETKRPSGKCPSDMCCNENEFKK